MSNTQPAPQPKSPKNVALAPFRWIRQLYDWVLRWGKSKHGNTALFVLSAAEASFFPIPPDVLLIALCVGAHKRWMRFALTCSLGSIVGGMLGYLIGWGAFDLIGEPILELVASLSGSSADQMLATAQYWFNEKQIAGMQVGVWAVGIAGFTPIPYKVFTIAAGFFQMSFPLFVLAATVSRTLRFFLVAGIIGLLFEKYGTRITDFIDRYFNLLAIIFAVLLIGGFILIGQI